MSLSGVLTALAEYVGDAIVNDCGRPVPDRVIRYHGTLPNDCCTDNGFLAVNWQTGFASVTFPAAATGTADPCRGLPVVEVRLRYVVCWDAPEVTQQGVTVNAEQDARWDADAAMLAEVADGVTRALLRLTCEISLDPLFVAVMDEVGPKHWLRFVAADPIVPLGGCAGVQWRLYCGVRSAGAVS
jgi:hypothetical protein